jgi:hypothetical protein
MQMMQYDDFFIAAGKAELQAIVVHISETPIGLNIKA